MSNNEAINTWDTDNLVGEELTDAELAGVQGGDITVNLNVYVPITNQIQVQVAAGNLGDILQIANQYA